MKIRSIILLLCFVFSSCTSTSIEKENEKKYKIVPVPEVNNYLNGTSWCSDGLLCLDENKSDYTLTEIPRDKGYVYGDFVSFSDSVNLRSYYSAPCGNDCFTTVFGKYKLVTDTTVIFKVDSVTFHGECSGPTLFGNGKEKEFICKRTDNGIRLSTK